MSVMLLLICWLIRKCVTLHLSDIVLKTHPCIHVPSGSAIRPKGIISVICEQTTISIATQD